MRNPGTIRAMMVALALVEGCAAPNPPPRVNLAGFPPAFREGYADGCRSAKPGALKQRDETRFAHDAQYATGWRDGNDICRKHPPQ